METSNNLKFIKSINSKNHNCVIKIRLNDECKNGHQDFSITGTFYEVGKLRTDRNIITAGCCHDDILKVYPEFKMFVDLHLCDYKGIPIHCVANGYYHITTGFDNLNGKTQKQYFCDYYRVTPTQYDTLFKSENQIEFGILLKELGILEQWESEANKAIKELERLTETKFLVDSERTQYISPTEEQIQDFKTKKANGYYNDKAKIKRKEEARKQKIKDIKQSIESDRDKVIKKENEKAKVSLWLVDKVEKTQKLKNKLNFEAFIDNSIYYDHTLQLSFNWKSYGKKVTKAEFKIFCDSLTETDFQKLPNGISFDLEKELTFKP